MAPRSPSSRRSCGRNLRDSRLCSQEAAGLWIKDGGASQECSSYGISPSELTIDSAQLLANVRAEVDRLNALHIDFLEKAGVTLIRGWGRFEDDRHIVVSSTPQATLSIVFALNG